MYRVHLDRFEGPLDLLLFFIRRDEVDIHDIPIARIADEYLEAVRAMQTAAEGGGLDLDAAADFIYTAALLIQIKVRMLLPRPELDEAGEPIDPRRELVERLLEYVRYKEAAGALEGRFLARQRHATRGQDADPAPTLDATDAPIRATLFDLLGAYASALRRGQDAPEPVRHEVARESYALDEQRAWILGRLSDHPAAFHTLVRDRSKAFVIVTFLAVLDLAQKQAVRLVFGLTPDDFALERVAAPAAQAA